MSIAIQDRTADSGIHKKRRAEAGRKPGSGRYNNVASPHGKVVDVTTGNRHRLLTSMFTQYTPRSERTIDFLMGLSAEHFALLCHHDGARLCLTMSKLDVIGDALEMAEQSGETVELDLTGMDCDTPLDKLAGPSDKEVRSIERETATRIRDARLAQQQRLVG